jgi:F-type H+-transporting ATPase subunit a
LTNALDKDLKKVISVGLFPLRNLVIVFMLRGFLRLAALNLVSLVGYSYPVTTTLSFNLRLALSLWFRRILFILTKVRTRGSLLPANSPWYLAPFLSLIEFISIGVRPVTLCFRLLANIRAGHVLLTLICKIALGL